MTRRTHDFRPPVQGFSTSHATTGGPAERSRAGGKVGKFDDTGFVDWNSVTFPASAPEKAKVNKNHSKDDTDAMGVAAKAPHKTLGHRRTKSEAGSPQPHEPEREAKGLRAMMRKLNCKG